MIDLDDISLVHQFDRNALFARAANIESRLPHVRSIVQAWATDAGIHISATQQATSPVMLCLPHELAGIGQIVTALAAERGTERPALARAVLTRVGSELDSYPWPAFTYYLAPGVHMPEQHEQSGSTDSQIIRLPAALSGDLHPVESLLALLIILDGFDTLDDSVVSTLARLHSCRPEVPIVENPAKQLALRLHDRIPLFWGSGLCEGVAADWKTRYLWYAEQMALDRSEDSLARLEVMARLPRFWPNTTLLLHIFHADFRADFHAGASSANAVSPRSTALKRLLGLRRFSLAEQPAPADLSSLHAACYLLELGEWVALYASALYNVDPADRVPLDWLDANN